MPRVHDLRVAVRSLLRARGLALAVMLTLGLGIGVNAAIFGLVRTVLLQPLANRDEAGIVYIRQSAPGLGATNTTFSVPEIRDVREGVTSFRDVAEFSTVTFSMIGLGEPRQVRAGVVSGNYFDVMGLRPVRGRLLAASDDGPAAAGAAVLTYRFWQTALNGDATVIGKTIRFDSRSAEIVGILEPSVPYPADTEVIANMVTSPHHLSATMVLGREHRMTEVFARLADTATPERARQELLAVHAAMTRDHPEAYPARAGYAIRAVSLRDEVTANARTVLIVLFAAALLVYIIACSNVANLILARTARRESELAVRTALGADHAALRRTLLAEALILCGGGAVLGTALAWPTVSLLRLYGSRFSVRAHDLHLDGWLVLVGVGLALVAAVVLAYAPRLPSSERAGGLRLATGSLRVAGGTRRTLNAFAVVQIGASFLLVVAAAMLVRTFIVLQSQSPGFEVARVLAVDVPVTSFGRTPDETRAFYRQLRDQVGQIPGVDTVAIGSVAPWRDSGQFERGGFAFQVEGGSRGDAADDPRARLRAISPGYFATLGVPLRAGREFNADDRDGSERVVIISETVAQRLFAGRDVVNRRLYFTDPVMKFIGLSPEPRRIVGVAADVDDVHLVPEPMMTVYQPFEQQPSGGRLFVHTRADAYALVPAVTKLVRTLAADQPVERAATLEDIRAEVLAPDRLNAMIFGLFAVVALVIAVIGVAGVLAFVVGGQTREFAIRIALGSRPEAILVGVLRSGALMAALGIGIGLLGSYVAARVAAGFVDRLQLPGIAPVVVSALALLGAALAASLVPAARAARVNVIDALKAE